MDEDDMDDDDTPRVVYADAEREGRMARYATGVGDGAEASRGSHDASQGGVFAYRGDAPGAAPWAFELDMDSAPPPTLLEDEDDQARSPARVDARTAPHGAFRSGGVREKRGLREDTTTRSDTRSDSDDDELVAAFPAAARVTSGSPSTRANPKTGEAGDGERKKSPKEGETETETETSTSVAKGECELSHEGYRGGARRRESAEGHGYRRRRPRESRQLRRAFAGRSSRGGAHGSRRVPAPCSADSKKQAYAESETYVEADAETPDARE